MNLDWLDDGSLQILLPEPLLSEWQGDDSDDYDRACAISSSWLNTISLNRNQGLLLGGDPGMVLVASGNDGLIVLIRWVYAEDENELVEFALLGNAVVESESDFVFNNTYKKWKLFNAAANPFSDNPDMKSLDLPIGKIRVETVYCKSNRNAAVVHRFLQSA